MQNVPLYFACAQQTLLLCRGIFITGSSLLGAAVREPRITSKNLIRSDQRSAQSLCSYLTLQWYESLQQANNTFLSVCSIIFCEAVAIYGVIVAIILQTKIESVDQLSNGLWPKAAYTAGYAILGSGLTTGWANLACGYVLCTVLHKKAQSTWRTDAYDVLLDAAGYLLELLAAVQLCQMLRIPLCLSRFW